MLMALRHQQEREREAAAARHRAEVDRYESLLKQHGILPPLDLYFNTSGVHGEGGAAAVIGTRAAEEMRRLRDRNEEMERTAGRAAEEAEGRMQYLLFQQRAQHEKEVRVNVLRL
jgi:hypothetical protein